MLLPSRGTDMVDEDERIEEVSGQSILGQVIARTSENNIKSQLNAMVTASRDVINKVNNGTFRVIPNPDQVCDFGKEKRLSISEVQFYKANSSAKMILRSLRATIDAAGPFKLFPDNLFSEEQKIGKFFIF